MRGFSFCFIRLFISKFLFIFTSYCFSCEMKEETELFLRVTTLKKCLFIYQIGSQLWYMGFFFFFSYRVQDLQLQARDQTWVPYIESMKSQPLDQQGNSSWGDSLSLHKLFSGLFPTIKKGFLGNCGSSSLTQNLSHSNCFPDIMLEDSEGRDLFIYIVTRLLGSIWFMSLFIY